MAINETMPFLSLILGKGNHPPVPNTSVGQLQCWRAGMKAGEVGQYWRAHETGPGLSE